MWGDLVHAITEISVKKKNNVFIDFEIQKIINKGKR